MNSFFHLMPKGELHLHLDGSLTPQLALHIILKENLYNDVLNLLKIKLNSRFQDILECSSQNQPIALSENFENDVDNHCQTKACNLKSTSACQETDNLLEYWSRRIAKFSNDYYLLSKEDKNLFFELLRGQLCVTCCRKSQADLLGHFDLPVLLLQSNYALTMLCENLIKIKAADNVRYIEIRWAPSLHTEKDLACEDVVTIVLDACQKYGKHYGVEVRLILCALRSQKLDEALQIVDIAKKYQSRGVVGVDIAGLEEEYSDLLAFLPFFRKAKEFGLGTSFHAGESWLTVNEYKKAILAIQPDRIAHGTTIYNDKEIIDFLQNNKIVLDLCPSSNIQAALWKNHQEFPLKYFHSLGVQCSLSTDDPVVSDLTLSEEYFKLYRSKQYKIDDLWEINLNAIRYAFCDNDLKKKLLTRFLEEYNSLLEGSWGV